MSDPGETQPTLTAITKSKKPQAQILVAMKWAVENLEVQKLPPERLRNAFKMELLPLVRQALRSAGGDGLDAYLRELLSIRGPKGENSLFADVIAHMERINRAEDRSALTTEAKRLVSRVRRRLEKSEALSLEVFTTELGDGVELDALLEIAFSSDAELKKRRTEAAHLIDKLRVQLKDSAGRVPETLHRTFSRLRLEKGLLEAESRRRGL